MNFRLIACSVLVSFNLSLFSSADEFREPNLEKKAFVLDELEIDKISKASLISGLLSAAKDYDYSEGVDYQLRAHALSMAAHLKPDSEKLEDILTQLKNRGSTAGDDSAKKERTISRITRGVKSLMKKKDLAANQICAKHCIDIAIRLGKGSENTAELLAFQKEIGTPDWKGFLLQFKPRNPWNYSYKAPKSKRSEEIAGGSAESLKSLESKAFALAPPLRRRTNCIYPITVTAQKTEDNPNLTVAISQKVGQRIGSSLAQVTEYIQHRHLDANRIPSGYKITIDFEDHEKVPETNSFGLPMAFALDSLFTGQEIDPSLALVGRINKQGKVLKIRDPLTQVLYSVDHDFKQVVLPQKNRTAIKDLYILRGIEPLLKTDFFVIKHFEKLLEMTSPEKGGSLEKHFKTYDKLKESLRGGDQLKILKNKKNRAVVDKLREEIPFFYSAKLLSYISRDKMPKELSPSGSNSQIHAAISPILHRIRFASENGFLKKKSYYLPQAEKSLQSLEFLDKKIHPSFAEYHGNILELTKTYHAVLKEMKDEEEERGAPEEIEEKWNEAVQSYQSLLRNPKIASALSY